MPIDFNNIITTGNREYDSTRIATLMMHSVIYLRSKEQYYCLR